MRYEDVYRVPYVLRGPAVRNPGRTSDAFISHVDLAPTILDLAGVSGMDGIHGRFFASLIRDEADRSSDPYWNESYAEFHGSRLFYTQRIVWHDRHKYVFNCFDIDELYDLARDPTETMNLALDPRNRPLLEDMAARMWRYAHRLGDHNITNSHYATHRTAPVGPLAGLT